MEFYSKFLASFNLNWIQRYNCQPKNDSLKLIAVYSRIFGILIFNLDIILLLVHILMWLLLDHDRGGPHDLLLLLLLFLNRDRVE